MAWLHVSASVWTCNRQLYKTFQNKGKDLYKTYVYLPDITN